MKKYHVFVTRASYSRPVIIEIEATDEEAATELALECAGDYEYSEKDAEYEIQAVEELK